MGDRPCGLAAIVALWTGGVTAAAMAVYASHEYFADGSASAGDLLRQHAWHVLALSAISYAVMWAVMHRVVLQPVREIDAHLYRIGSGRLHPLVLRSRVLELQTVARGVNLMVMRMELNRREHGLDRVQADLEKLREFARSLRQRSRNASANEDAEMMLRVTASLQAAFGELLQSGETEQAKESEGTPRQALARLRR